MSGSAGLKAAGAYSKTARKGSNCSDAERIDNAGPAGHRQQVAEARPTERLLEELRSELRRVIRGKDASLDLVLVGVLAGGHVLLEDVPGVGKTTLAKALAAAMSMDFARVQFTPDLLPTDILGSNVLDPQKGTFTFHTGPVFTQVLLADEINRASPRTQSALLEAMSEGQATVDGATRKLPAPFFVIATQNPVDFQGTYPLPEAQLDRFLLRIQLGYPDEVHELEVLSSRRTEDPLKGVKPVASAADVLRLQEEVRNVHIEPNVARYLLRVVRETRDQKSLILGASTRGALALSRAAQARALMSRRSFVSPDDVRSLAEAVIAHRLLLAPEARYGGKDARQIIRECVDRVPVPT
ncbi:MAG: MoxR family ATPase [Deltaproteobacteria bacterium]|nr:MoxR family ATPase [Deltaproteobacteria bacterium]